MSNPSNLSERHAGSTALAGATPQQTLTTPERAVRHRMMNLVSVIQAIIRLSARDAEDVAGYARALSARINALALAHGTGMGTPGTSGAGFRTLVQRVISPHARPGSAPDLDGPDFLVPDRAITSVALVLHELAAQARTGGAWASPGGRIHLAWSTLPGSKAGTQTVRLIWTEIACNLRAEVGDGFSGTDAFAALLFQSSIAQLEGSHTRVTETSTLRHRLEFSV